MLCTVENSWWWTEELSETWRVLFQKQIWELNASSWFYYKNLSRCTVTWTWKDVSCGLLNVRLLSKQQRFMEQTVFCKVVSTRSPPPYGIRGYIATILLHQNTTGSYPKPDESISHIPTLILTLKIIISKHSAMLKVALAFVTSLRSTNVIGSS